MSIEAKIQKYLQKELVLVTDPTEQKNRQEVLQYLAESEGECSGLSAMWAYSKMTAAGEAETFFNRTNKLLLEWDGERAVSCGSLAIVQELIRHQVDTKKGIPLIHAKSHQIAELLLENGASAEVTQYSKTPLLNACSNKNVEMVKGAYTEGTKDHPGTRDIAVKFVKALRDKVEVRKNNGGFVDKLHEAAAKRSTNEIT